MTEPSVKKKIENSRQHVGEALKASEKWQSAWKACHVTTTIAAVGLSLALGVGGKNAAEAIGSIVTNQQDAVVTGWQTTCWAVGIFVAVSYFASTFASEQSQAVSRGRTLHAALKNLVVDLEDNERNAKEVTRDYQRLTESFPEFAD